MRPKKRLSQHFLQSDADAGQIVSALVLSPDDTVLEIGPGLGVLTRHLLREGGTVIAVEVDADLVEELRRQFGGAPRFHLLHRDILGLDLGSIRREHGAGALKIIGNLPYALTTPIFFHLLRYQNDIESAVLTVQKEVADRILASPGGKEYGALTIAIQYRTMPERLFELPASAFYPQPKVDSTVLRLRMRDRPAVTVGDEAFLFRLVRASFQQRRKMLRNALAAAFTCTPEDLQNIADSSAIDLRRRGETLSLVEFGRLSDTVQKAMVSRS
jgi:16S rRNA (adenine1518-N6/adenine1519-N6)-dimethyltransferase